METKSIIKNYSLVREGSKVEDLFGFDENIKKIESLINNMSESAIIGLVGNHGEGKSTAIYQVEKKLTGNKIWVNFEAWSHPDRKGMWDGFIIEVARSVGGETGVDLVKSKIDGNLPKNKKLISVGIKTVLGVAGLGEGVAELFDAPPHHRISEMETILKTIVDKQDKDFVIIAEDVDRSGEEGLFFLETLSNFIRNHELKNKVTVLSPISRESYRNSYSSFNKCLDHVELFSPKITVSDEYVSEVFSDELFEKTIKDPSGRTIYEGRTVKLQVKDFMQCLFDQESQMNIRLLKTIIRQTNTNYLILTSNGHNPDWRVVLAVEASKHFSESNGQRHFDRMRSTSVVSWNAFSAFMFSIYSNRDGLLDINSGNLQGSTLPIEFLRGLHVSDLETVAYQNVFRSNNRVERFVIPRYYLED